VSGINELSLQVFGSVTPDQCGWFSFFGRRYDTTYADLVKEIDYQVIDELV
jgi:hypothetical protein